MICRRKLPAERRNQPAAKGISGEQRDAPSVGVNRIQNILSCANPATREGRHFHKGNPTSG